MAESREQSVAGQDQLVPPSAEVVLFAAMPREQAQAQAPDEEASASPREDQATPRYRGKSLAAFPNEILLEIFRCVGGEGSCGNAALRNLSLACKAFNKIANAVLYAEIKSGHNRPYDVLDDVKVAKDDKDTCSTINLPALAMTLLSDDGAAGHLWPMIKKVSIHHDDLSLSVRTMEGLAVEVCHFGRREDKRKNCPHGFEHCGQRLVGDLRLNGVMPEELKQYLGDPHGPQLDITPNFAVLLLCLAAPNLESFHFDAPHAIASADPTVWTFTRLTRANRGRGGPSQSFTALKNLHIGSNRNVTPLHAIEWFLRRSPNLERLFVGNAWGSGDRSRPLTLSNKHITSLILDNSWLSRTELMTLFNGCSDHMTEFSLSRLCRTRSDFTKGWNWARLPKVHTPDELVQFIGLTTAASTLERLTIIEDVPRGPRVVQMPAHNGIRILPRFPALKELHLNAGSIASLNDVDDDFALSNLIRDCPNLESFTISMASPFIEPTIGMARNLKTYSIHFCNPRLRTFKIIGFKGYIPNAEAGCFED